ncbi:MAG: hypothetical protein JWL86_4492 [Rhizobium sp.]|nr:hypothetical protein [Rhizobium sp.]
MAAALLAAALLSFRCFVGRSPMHSRSSDIGATVVTLG